ncbi:uncharacterized protein LOC142985813 [Anticarsia gemmatalis]|uniref:uncharacterized protein LOC142985813 n=1 Tax=Anticarsia gemmatalis TaxID=129554 RepID=UPI003F76556E
MLTIRVCVLLFFVILAECGRSVSRHNSGGLKKEPQAKVAKRPVRGEVFDNLFNVYDPSFLAVVWPKITNGLHILVDHTCWDELGGFFRDLTEGRAWAYNALDASGRYESALFAGNRFWLGSKEQCLKLDQEAYENNGSRSNYLVHTTAKNYYEDDVHDWKWVGHQEETTTKVSMTDRWPPNRLAYTTVQICLNITKTNLVKTSNVILGVCLPRSCSPRDVTSVINFSIMINDNLKTNKTTSRTAKITSTRQVPGSYDIAEDAGAILLICITVILATLVVAATIVDLDLLKCLPYGKKSMTFDLEKYNLDNRTVEREPKHEAIDMKSEIDKLGVENANMNYMAVESMIKGAPVITLDVTCADRNGGSCRRCGKYRKQCSNPRQLNNLPPCPRLQYNSFASLSTESKKRSIFCRLLLCFSVPYCWKRVFNTNTANKDLSLIHGMRIFATFWIIFLHIAVIVDYISDDAGDINDQSNNIYNIIATGTIAFDTLFFVSGLFSSHHFFYLKSQYSVQELVGWGGACGQLLQFVCFVTNRVIRMLPSYAFALLLSAVVARWSRATATLALPDGDHTNCNDYWWRNLLYVSNIFPSDEQCMQVSWYLSTETQVHVWGALLCAVSATSGLRARAAVALALVAGLAATVADASAAYFEFTAHFVSGFSAYATIIERPWARVAPYFIGIFTGWLIHVISGKLKVSKVTSSLLWVSAVSFMFVSVAITMVGLPWLAAWLHLSWPIALLWPVLMGTTNLSDIFRRLLANSPVAALSRLCYGMLLLHPAVSRAVLLSLDSTLCSQTICIWLYFTGTTILTLLAALLLSLLVEMPCCSLLRRLSDCAS